MTLRKKTLAIIAVTTVSLIAILYIISRVFLLSGYARLEEQSTHQSVERVLGALSEEITVLDTTVFNWASWDDTYAFIEDRNPDYVQSNLIDEAFLTIGLNLMLFVDAFGQKVFAKGFDLDNDTEVPVPQAFLGDLLANDLLMSHHETESNITGVVLLSEGPMLVASRPILTSKNEGPVRGALVMGRYLDTTEIERLAQVTHLSFTVQPFDDSLLPPDFQEARVVLSGKETMFVRPISDESIAGYALLEDIYGKPALLLKVDMPREIYKQGQASIAVFMSFLLAAGLTFGVVTLLLLERQVLNRLAHLGRSVSRIGTRGDLSARVAMGETDEVSRVASSINEMLSELEQSEKALRESEARFRHLYDSNMLGIAFWKSSGVIEDGNDAYLDMIGYDRQELQSGKVRWQDLTPPEYAHLDKKGLEQLRATGICSPFEKEYIRRDGTRIPVLIGAAFLNGEDDMGVSYLINLAEHQRVETALSQANTKLQALQQVTEAIHSTLALDDVFRKITDGLVHSMGYTSAFIAHLNDQKDRIELKAFSTQRHLVPQIDKILGFPLRTFSFSPDPETNATIKSVMNGRQVVAKTLTEVAHPLISKGTCLALQKFGRIKNYIVTPLKFDEEIVGALIITTTREEVSEEELNVIMTFANAATRAIRNADLHTQTKGAEEALRQRASQLQIIAEVARKATSILDPEALLSYAVKAIQQRFAYYHVDIFLLDHDRSYAVFATSSNPVVKKEWKERNLRFKVGKEGMIGWVAQSGEPLLANNVSQEPHYLPDELLPETESELTVPLKVEGRVVGVLDLQDNGPNAFKDDDIFVLETLGHQVAIAIENARLFQEGQRHTNEVSALREVSLATLSTLDRDQVFEIMLDQLSKVIDYDTAAIKVFTPDGRDKMIAGRGPIIEEQVMWDGFDVRENEIIQEMRETRQPVVVGDTHIDERFEPVGNWEAFHSWAGAPLFVKDEFAGYLAVEKVAPGFYDESAVQLLENFAHAAAIALENAELYDATKRRAEEMSSLHKITLLTTSTLDVNEVLELIYERIDHLMKPDTFYIALYDEQQQKLNFEIFMEKGELFDKFSKEAEEMGLSGWIIQSKSPLLIRNIAKEPLPVIPGVVGEPIPPELCYLGVPIMKKDKVIGVISVQCFQPYVYDEEDQHFLSAIADQAAVAIENARLFEEAQKELAERERTEKALRESEGRFRRLYDSNTLGIVYWDSSDRLVDANDAFLDIIGYTRQDLLTSDLHLQAITPLEYRHLDKQGFKDLRKTGTCSPFEKEYVRKNGTRVPVLIGGAFLESGGKMGVSYVIDITERKQMEKALHASEERFALAVQGANDGIWDWDIQQDSLYWSPRMKELLGYADDELDVDFDTFEATLHPDDREHTKAVMEARLKDGKLYDVDHRIRTKSGEYHWFHVRGQVVFDEAGDPVRMIGSTADITDRKQAEERLHRTLEGVIEALGQTTETRDLYTAGHQKRVTQLACAIAKEMGLSEKHIEGIRIAGLVHDIGKMAIPAEILSKPSRLSEMEYGLIKAHPQLAYNILKTIEFPWPVAQIVLQHHERMDGSGYPQGLKGEQILMEARILAVADVVEAMASHRPYRPALGIDKALEEISQNKGALYDPVVVATCLRLFDKKMFSFAGDPTPNRL